MMSINKQLAIALLDKIRNDESSFEPSNDTLCKMITEALDSAYERGYRAGHSDGWNGTSSRDEAIENADSVSVYSGSE
jgi:hypothetical protein